MIEPVTRSHVGLALGLLIAWPAPVALAQARAVPEGRSAEGALFAPIPMPTPLPGVSGGYLFSEAFRWQGNHAAALPAAAGGGTTVWWSNDAWDARQDTHFNTVGTGGHHVDIHKAASPDPHDATESNGVYVLGGDGSPGIGTMRLAMEAIVSARLRNPMLISEANPGVVTFYAPRFVSAGHWWEVGILPVSAGVHGAEYSPVPTPLLDPTAGPRNGDEMPGPGHRPAADGLNFVTGGFDDCPSQGEWYFFHSNKKSVGGVSSDAYNPAPSLNDVGFSSPDEEHDLFQWRLVFKPSGVDLLADFEKDGVLDFKQHFTVAIPWSEVHVHLMGIAYQANHHPASFGCGLEAFGTTEEEAKIREIHWRNVSVSPVKYARTSVAPRDVVVGNAYQQGGWQLHDLRDTQRFGPPVNGVPKPNLRGYDDPYAGLTYLFTSFDSGFGFAGGLPQLPEFVVETSLTAEQAGAAAAQLVYDVRTPPGSTGTAGLFVNGQLVGALRSDEPGAAEGSIGPSWKHRSTPIPAGMLHPGVNTVRIVPRGRVQMDRLQLEFFHAQ